METKAMDLLWMVVKNLEQMRFEMKSRGDARKINGLYKQLMEQISRITNSEKCFVIHNIISNNQYNFIKKAMEAKDE